MALIIPSRPYSITLRRPAVNGSATSGITAVSTISIRSIELPAKFRGCEHWAQEQLGVGNGRIDGDAGIGGHPWNP